MPRKDYENSVDSAENCKFFNFFILLKNNLFPKKRLIGKYSDPEINKFIKSTPLENNYDKAFSRLREGLLHNIGYNFLGPNAEDILENNEKIY